MRCMHEDGLLMKETISPLTNILEMAKTMHNSEIENKYFSVVFRLILRLCINF